MQPVAQPMQQNGVEPRITEEDLDRAFGGGISSENRLDLFPDGLEHAAYS